MGPFFENSARAEVPPPPHLQKAFDLSSIYFRKKDWKREIYTPVLNHIKGFLWGTNLAEQFSDTEKHYLKEKIETFEKSETIDGGEFLKFCHEFSYIISHYQSCESVFNPLDSDLQVARKSYTLAVDTLSKLHPHILVIPTFNKFSLEELNNIVTPTFVMDMSTTCVTLHHSGNQTLPAVYSTWHDISHTLLNIVYKMGDVVPLSHLELDNPSGNALFINQHLPKGKVATHNDIVAGHKLLIKAFKKHPISEHALQKRLDLRAYILEELARADLTDSEKNMVEAVWFEMFHESILPMSYTQEFIINTLKNSLGDLATDFDKSMTKFLSSFSIEDPSTFVDDSRKAATWLLSALMKSPHS